jgi:hypothetical protein
MKNVRWMEMMGMCLVAFALLLRPINSFALSGPPPLTDLQIGAWSFDDTNWETDDGPFPISFTNLDNPSDWDGRALQVDSPHPAWLQYNIVENSGETNLAFTQGTIQLWFLPDWNSGHGPGDSGRLIDVGANSTNHLSSWWSLYFSPGGTNIYFSSETNGVQTNYLSVPISWASNNWHLIDLTYSTSGSQLYLDGQLMTNGAGSAYQPSLAAFTNGFFVGSDVTGTQQMRGLMDNLATFNYPLDAGQVTFNYNQATNDGTGGGTNFDNPAPNYGTNLFLTVGSMLSNTIPLVLTNSPNDVLLEIQGCTNLAEGNWFSVGFVNGSELTNWTPASVYVSKQGNLFLRIRSWQDSTGTGIPDWWWITFFGETTNVDAYASAENDGFSNLQKYEMGLNPTEYYNPNPPGGFFGYLNRSGTNAFIAWSPVPGPVLNYAIQRGIQGTNGNYVYSQIGLVSSNATLFEDVGAITNANAQNNIYTLTAVYPGGAFSGTDIWQVAWYADLGSSGPPYGPPLPNNFYASVTSTGTNVQLSWTAPIGGAPTNYVIERGIFNSTNFVYNYAQIAILNTNTTNFTGVGAMTNANNWSDGYQISAVYPGNGLSQPATSYVNVGSTNGVAAAGTFYGYLDSTRTNIFLTWSPAPGSVTHYIIYGSASQNISGGNIYTAIGEVSGSTTSFEVVGATDGEGDFLYTAFAVVAVYADGSESQAASWTTYSNAPAPGALYAYLNATGTNVQLSWSAATGAITGYLIQRGDFGNFDYYQIAETTSNTISYVDTNEFNNAPAGIGVVSYEVQAMYPNGGLSPGVTAMVSYTPPPPSNLTAFTSSTGTNVTLTWSPALGTVTNYIILRGAYNPTNGSYSYSQIAEVSGSTTSFQDIGAANDANNDNYIYELEAASAGGLSQPDSASFDVIPPANYNISVTAQMVRNSTGRWQLMFSGIPTNVTTLQLYIAPYGNNVIGVTTNEIINNYFSSQDLVDTISISNLNNGCFVIPDAITTNEIGDNAGERVVGVQPVGKGSLVGKMSFAGFLPYDAPCFVNGQQHLKQNLLFELRGATISQPVGLTENNVWISEGSLYASIPIPTGTNYVESSIFHWSEAFKEFGSVASYTEKNDLWPFTVNYALNTGLYNTNYTGPSSFVWQTNLATIPAPAVLGISDPYWIVQNVADLSDFGITASTSAGNSVLTQQNGVHNLYGLQFETALLTGALNQDSFIIPGGPWPLPPGTPVTISPGDVTLTSIYSQTTDPDLETEGYYFAVVNTPGPALTADNTPIQPSPIPCLPGFSSTNQTGLMVASVGNSAVIGGWNKFGIAGSSKFAYLGQYYITNAFVITNGVVTTNTTGVLSPYGDFFPTQVGQVALVTMPDINTGQQGTGAVDVISLNVDANHDGKMDFSYGGPDFASVSKPFRFWVNDVDDVGDDLGDGIPGAPGSIGDGLVFSDGANGPAYSIQGSRNLVNFFPVYLNIGNLFQSNALSAGISATDTNYQFVLSQADGALRFAYTDLMPTNYMNFLHDTNEVFDYLHDASLTTVSNLNSGGVPVASSFLSLIAGNHGGIILVEAWTNTTQPLVLTIYHGTNQIVQTSLALSISGVEQMFRSKTMLLHPESGTNADRLTDASVPNEPDTTDVNFIFVHGYNVSPQQARGWDADYYKRLYWSGSHAKFYGVTWEAADSQADGQVTINLQTNIVNAFNTAPLLNTFLNSLSGTNVVVAHSLGNMLVLSTLNDCSNRTINTYFMVDAAVAIEAIDDSAPSNPDMYPTAWTNYEGSLWASDWYALFPTNDYRSTLTWRGRLTNLQNANVYNFYSSGEEVLRDYATDPPTNLLGIAVGQLVSLWKGDTGEYTWAWQEKLKGLMLFSSLLSSDHGGWSFNLNYYTNSEDGAPPTHMSASNAAALPNSELQTNAFFDFTSEYNGNGTFTADLALYGSSGSSYARANQNRILSDAIPCLTLPVGANLVPRLQPPESPFQMNFDMQANYENGWPLDRPARTTGAVAAGEWHHSDNRAVAYTFTYKLFNQLVTVGNLK